MADRQVVIGIDIAATRPCTAVAVQVGRVAHATDWLEAQHPEGTRDMLAWIDGHAPAVVGIDAPQGYNRRLLTGRGGRAAAGAATAAGRSRSRVCDRELLRRRIGVYQVPSKEDVAVGAARLPTWMDVGFAYFRALKKRGFEVPMGSALPVGFDQPPALLEVYPHAAFVTLLGHLLPRKTTREGLRRRIHALRAADLRWDEAPGSEYYDHDSLDALAAALTAWRYLQGRASAVGDAREGLLWLPVERLASAYGE